MDSAHTHNICATEVGMMDYEKKSEDRAIEAWLKMVDGRIVGNKRKTVYHSPEPTSYSNAIDPADQIRTQTMNIRDEEVCVVEIPRRSLLSMYETQQWYSRFASGMSIEEFDKIVRAHYTEKQIRAANPAVQKAYEQYQILLNLTHPGPYNKFNQND